MALGYATISVRTKDKLQFDSAVEKLVSRDDMIEVATEKAATLLSHAVPFPLSEPAPLSDYSSTGKNWVIAPVIVFHRNYRITIHAI